MCIRDSLGGWATPWSAEELLNGQHQRDDIPAHAGTAHSGLQQKRLEEDFCWIVCHVSRTTQSVKVLNCSELTFAIGWALNIKTH